MKDESEQRNLMGTEGQDKTEIRNNEKEREEDKKSNNKRREKTTTEKEDWRTKEKQRNLINENGGTKKRTKRYLRGRGRKG